MQRSESLVRVLTCRVRIKGSGRVAKMMSVKMLMLLLKRPIAVKVCMLKHFAPGVPAGSHEARTGTQEKRIVWMDRQSLILSMVVEGLG